MRQLLMLGFYCEVYRREPLCRVYVNDVLVDEFNIPQIDQVQAKVDPLDPLDPQRLENFITNPPFIKYIEFDDADADALDVVLKIQNDDNNHANGFMSKYTQITLSHLFLASKKVLENIDELKNNFKFSRKNWKKFNCDILDFYSNSNRNELFANFFEKISSIAFNFPNTRFISNTNLTMYKIGTSGHLHLTLKKKLGFWRSSIGRCRGSWGRGYVGHVKYLYDKYKQHEDKRSNDT